MIRRVEESAPAAKTGEVGGCWLWLIDNQHELVRQGRVTVTGHGKYIANLPEFSSSRGLAQREEMTPTLAALIKQEYGIDAVYFSVLGSENPEAPPFYNGDLLDDQNIYNKSDNPKDY